MLKQFLQRRAQRWLDRKTDALMLLCQQMTAEIEHVKDAETREMLQGRVEDLSSLERVQR